MAWPDDEADVELRRHEIAVSASRLTSLRLPQGVPVSDTVGRSDTRRIVYTPTAKIADVERWIAETEGRLQSARQDLAHLQATRQRFRRGDAQPILR